MFSWTRIFEADPKELLAALKEKFSTRLPTQIETPEEMWEAQKMLSRLASQYSFLMAAAVEIKGYKRRLKREKADKALIDDMMEREEMLTSYCDAVRMNYNAVSRMITIRQQVYDELRMTKSMP